MNALDGIRILDLTRLLPGAICTMMLADLGATIIKIEDPNGGDYARWMPPMLGDLGAFFRASNRNKQSVIINLKLAEGQAVFHRLVEQADVVIESFRPGVTERLKIDAPTLMAINPRLLYCSLSGWGQTGPYRELSGHDLNYVSLNGVQGAMRSPQPLGVQVADIGGSYVGVAGICAALFQRERTGQGNVIDVALSEAGMPFTMYQWVEALIDQVPRGMGALNGGKAFYDVYFSADEQPLALAALEPKFWQNFCTAVNHPEWLPLHMDDDAQPQLRAQLIDLFASQTASEWEAQLNTADCCFTRITPLDQLADDPHIQARDMLPTDADGVPTMRSPIHLSANDAPDLAPAPAYGEHTRLALLTAGYTEAEIDVLVNAGAIGLKPR